MQPVRQTLTIDATRAQEFLGKLEDVSELRPLTEAVVLDCGHTVNETNVNDTIKFRRQNETKADPTETVVKLVEKVPCAICLNETVEYRRCWSLRTACRLIEPTFKPVERQESPKKEMTLQEKINSLTHWEKMQLQTAALLCFIGTALFPAIINGTIPPEKKGGRCSFLGMWCDKPYDDYSKRNEVTAVYAIIAIVSTIFVATASCWATTVILKKKS